MGSPVERPPLGIRDVRETIQAYRPRYWGAALSRARGAPAPAHSPGEREVARVLENLATTTMWSLGGRLLGHLSAVDRRVLRASRTQTRAGHRHKRSRTCVPAWWRAWVAVTPRWDDASRPQKWTGPPRAGSQRSRTVTPERAKRHVQRHRFWGPEPMGRMPAVVNPQQHPGGHLPCASDFSRFSSRQRSPQSTCPACSPPRVAAVAPTLASRRSLSAE